MPPILHVMRHGQGYHSAEVNKDGHLIRDPHLTEKGIQQCKHRCSIFDRHGNVELLLASPLRRAIQTCQYSFAPCVSRGMTIIALPMAEEVSEAPCDTGSDASVLREEFTVGVDFSHLQAEWFKHVGAYATNAQAVNERARKLRVWIRDRPEKEIALVSHGFFNHFLTGEVDDEGKQTTPWWGEAELRTYRFKDDDTHMATLVESEDSLLGRGEALADGSKGTIVNDPAKRGKEAVEVKSSP